MASWDLGLGLDIPCKGICLAHSLGLPCNPELTSAAHLAGLRSPVHSQGKGGLSVGSSGLAWAASPSSQAKISGETQPSGLLVREASDLDFQIPESSLLESILCLTS